MATNGGADGPAGACRDASAPVPEKDAPDRVQDQYDGDKFESVLAAAIENAANEWECDFVTDMESRFEEWGKRMYLSARQQEILERIAGDG